MGLAKIRELGRALGHTGPAPETSADSKSKPAVRHTAASDSLEAKPGYGALLPPSAFGVAPPKVVRTDLLELTKPGDVEWSKGAHDKACKIWEGLAGRFVSEPLPMVKLVIAYAAMGEQRGLKLAVERLISLVPGAKQQAMCFLRLFNDRPEKSSAEFLQLSLRRALGLGNVMQLSSESLRQLLTDAQIGGMPLLAYAVVRCDKQDLDTVLQLVLRAGVGRLADQVAVALTLAEEFGREEKLGAMLRAGLRPGTAKHLDRLVDKAVGCFDSALLEMLLATCLRPHYTRNANGVVLNLAQVTLAAASSDYTLSHKLGVLAAHGALTQPVRGGDDIIVMAILRGARAVAGLLNNGVQVNVRNRENGNTLLIEAASRGAADCVGVLLGCGANLKAKNHAELDAVDMARINGFTQVEQQIRMFPTQLQLDKLLTLLWGPDIFNRMASVRTDIYKFNHEQIRNLLTYLMPVLGFGTIPDNFGTLDPWTKDEMRARRMPVMKYVDRDHMRWLYLVHTLVPKATTFKTAHWQALAELTAGFKDAAMLATVVHELLADRKVEPRHWKAVATSIDGVAYRALAPEVRFRVVCSAIDLRGHYGSMVGSALDWLNEVPVQGFDAMAFHSVMTDFVWCQGHGGDCARLADYVREGSLARNKLGLRPSLAERVGRIEAFGKSLWPEAGAKPNPTSGPTREPRATYDKRAALSQTLNRAVQAATSSAALPWVERANADCQEAIGHCMAYFGSTVEMAKAAEGGSEEQVLSILYAVFGQTNTWVILRENSAGSFVRRSMLRWHPDKLPADRAELAADMTGLLMLLRDRLEDAPLRSVLLGWLVKETAGAGRSTP